MDSSWFAVDAAGHVAVFETGEGGAIPDGEGFPMGGQAESPHRLASTDLLIPLIERRAATDPRLAALLAEFPAWRDTLAQEFWELGDEAALFAWLGLFRYECDEPWATPYRRQARVPNPATLDMLPPDVRERFARARLPVTFADAPRVAVPEHVPSVGWSDTWSDLQGNVHTFSGEPVDDRFADEAVDAAPDRAPSALNDDEVLAALRVFLSRPAKPGGVPRPPAASADGDVPPGLVARLLKWFGG
jgi:hypothetical protein